MRPHWWRVHPVTCTCVDCNDARLRKIGGTREKSGERNRKKKGRGSANSQVQPDEILNPRPTQVDLDRLPGSDERLIQKEPTPNEHSIALPVPHSHAREKPCPAQRYRSGRGRIRRRRVSPIAAGLSLMAGIVFAVFLVVPLLPDAAAEFLVDIQSSIGGVFG